MSPGRIAIGVRGGAKSIKSDKRFTLKRETFKLLEEAYIVYCESNTTNVAQKQLRFNGTHFFCNVTLVQDLAAHVNLQY